MSAVAEAEAKAILDFKHNEDVQYDPVNGQTNNDRLSPQMRVTPLRKGEVAIYKLIASDQKDLSRVDLKGNPLNKTQGYSMTGIKKIFDPFASRVVTITSGIAKERKTKTPFGDITSTRPEPIIFSTEKPVRSVTYDQPELYSFLERCDENIDNPYRSSKVKPRFYRVNAQRRAMKENEKNELKTDATHWVLRQASFKDLLRCAEQLKHFRSDINIRTDYKNSEASSAFELLKRELFAVAEKDPESLIKASNKRDAQVKMIIKDAERFKIIMFVDGKDIRSVANKLQNREWFYNDENLNNIHVVEPGKEKYEGLMEFFMTDEGQKHLTKISETLKTVLTARR